jgi:hypothetical protein
MNQNPLPWQLPEWLETAHDWMRTELARQNLSILGEIEQTHIRPWSTVLRVVTNQGIVYFKASAPIFGHETALTGYLASFAPECAPELLALDLRRQWLLMRDAGTALRAHIKQTRSIERWREVLPHFAGLQKGLTAHQGELLALGVFDRRLVRLPALFEGLLLDETAMLLEQPEGLTAVEYQRLCDFTPQFERLCARLASYGIPESLHHDDLHDGNVFVRDGRVTLTDWGESAVAHPFFSLVVMLRGLENTLELAPDAPELKTLRDWYLAHWTEYALGGTAAGGGASSTAWLGQPRADPPAVRNCRKVEAGAPCRSITGIYP